MVANRSLCLWQAGGWFFFVHVIVGAFFGLVYLLIPDVWGNLVGWPTPDPYPYRLIGAAVLGFSTSSWLAYKAAEWEQVMILVQMEIVWTILGTLAMLWALLIGGMPAIGWLNTATLAGFAIVFYYFYSRAKKRRLELAHRIYRLC